MTPGRVRREAQQAALTHRKLDDRAVHIKWVRDHTIDEAGSVEEV